MPRNGLARAAFEQGKTRYFTGQPCIHGHIAERMVSNGCCIECLNTRRGVVRQRIKAWKRANPDKVAEYARRYANRHPETHKKASAKYHASHAEQIRERDREIQRRIRKTYPEREKRRIERWKQRQEVKRVELAQRPKPEVCEICDELNIRIVFDHSHARGHFRGWICDRCNRVLGLVKDSPGLLLKLADYLKETEYGKDNVICAQFTAVQ